MGQNTSRRHSNLLIVCDVYATCLKELDVLQALAVGYRHLPDLCSKNALCRHQFSFFPCAEAA
jgi:hypothetical protein